ncbi:hypothetical protein BHE74_00001817 [Ensete ventricosum]|nr:hypothetical protein GW17_00007115 [Ensete ventricosum]RWW89250.1 hypothetical protein BHE74_00001817 [Ensete ventricosum]
MRGTATACKLWVLAFCFISPGLLLAAFGSEPPRIHPNESKQADRLQFLYAPTFSLFLKEGFCAPSSRSFLLFFLALAESSLKRIAAKLKINWDFDVDPCSRKGNWNVQGEKGFESSVDCDCSFNNNSLCRVLNM